MRIEQTGSRVIVRLDSAEVKSVGLPKRAAYVAYSVKGGCLLDDYSAWLVVGGCAPSKVDALIAKADAAINQPLHKEAAA